MRKQSHRVVVVGGGFGGLYVVRSLRRAAVSVTLIDRRNFHLFQPLLYQVALGELSPANIASPLRHILKRQPNAQVVLGEVEDLDTSARRVVTREGEVAYDDLVIATGAEHNYFGNPQWQRFAPGLKSVEDATEIRRRVLLAFEAAERERDHARIASLLTFVVIGGGPTGVELAGALAGLSRDTLRHEFRHIQADRAHVILVEGGERILPSYAPVLSSRAQLALERLGVSILTDAMVKDIRSDHLLYECEGATHRIDARCVMWGAGVRPSPMGRVLVRRTGADLDRAGRVIVEPDCSVPGHPNVFVIGDLAHHAHQGGKPLPGVAPVAMQQGQYVAALIRRRLTGKPVKAFRYRNYGEMATIGRAAAVADLGWIRFAGYPAWLAWLFIHLMYIVGFENRLLVLLQWAWNYFTYNRVARLITGTPAPLDLEELERRDMEEAVGAGSSGWNKG